MIRCIRCDKEFADGAVPVLCDRCGERLPQGAEARPAAPEPDYGTIRAFLPPLAEPSPPPVLAGEPLPASSAAPAAGEAAGEAVSSPPLDAHHLETIAEYRKGKALIAVIGFGGSGKTFFVNRLRDQLPRGPWKCSRMPAREIPASPEGLELTRFVPTGAGLARRAGAGKGDHSYTVVDCAGESLVQAIERQQETASLDAVTARSYLAALALASAYVLVIRAEDLAEVARDGAPRRLEGLVGGFYDIVHAIVIAKERLRREGPEELLERGIGRQELAAAFDRSRTRCPQPLCVAFSQADRLERLPAHEDGYDADPYLFALRHARKLWNAVYRSFTYHRFDFLSSFYRHHAEAPGDNIRPDYRLPSYGAAETFAWIDGLLAPSPPVLGEVWRIAAGRLPTRHAVAMRCLVDPRFRRERAG